MDAERQEKLAIGVGDCERYQRHQWTPFSPGREKCRRCGVIGRGGMPETFPQQLRHTKVAVNGPRIRCSCGASWPCDAIRLCDELERWIAWATGERLVRNEKAPTVSDGGEG